MSPWSLRMPWPSQRVAWRCSRFWDGKKAGEMVAVILRLGGAVSSTAGVPRAEVETFRIRSAGGGISFIH